jgi:hypothetical protein
MKRYCAPALLVLALHGAAYAEPSLRRDVGPNTNAAYEKECGGCHFAYQPGWLPERSWRKLMGSLGQHFGENTELKPEQRDALLAYLVAGAADHRRSQRSLEVLAAITPGDTPTRISSVLYVGGIHGGFLDPAFRGKPEVKTLAQCPACHQQANRGWFSAVTYSVSDEDFRGNALKSTPAGAVSQRLPK